MTAPLCAQLLFQTLQGGCEPLLLDTKPAEVRLARAGGRLASEKQFEQQLNARRLRFPRAPA
jgi:hypothetical protein